MVQYATAAELQDYLQQDVDVTAANQALTLASGVFSQAACTWFAATAVTYTMVGSRCTSIRLPFHPVTAVSAMRINSVAVTGFTLIKDILYRPDGFGIGYAVPPDKVEIDLTHGYASVPDDVKAAVLEMAATVYAVPVAAVVAESIDDYQVRYGTSSGGVQLSSAATALAAQYRGTFAA